MKNGWVIGAAIVLVPVFAVVSCVWVPVPPVNDLALVSVDVVVQSDIPTHEKWWNTETTGPLLRVTFSSRYDFQKLAKQWNYYVGQHTTYCNGGVLDAQNEIDGFPDVYDEYGQIDEYVRSSRVSRTNQSGRILYHIYFATEQHGNVNFKPYDLVQSPRDICIQLNGHNEVAGEIATIGFKSNVLIVPKADLTAALARAKMRPR